MPNYAPTTWATSDLITSTKLNNIEDGLNNLTIAGTANQVLVNGATTALNNTAITLTLPQSIGTGSSPTFAGLTLNGQLDNLVSNNVVNLLMADASADATGKEARTAMRHYTNAEESLALIGGAMNASAAYVLIGGGFSNMNAATEIDFYTAANTTTVTGTLRATIDSAGNIGHGVTPKAWTDFTAFQWGSQGVLGSTTAVGAGAAAFMVNNAYWDGTWKRIQADEASQYRQVDGTHIWYVAASSTADSAITWTTAMTINNSADIYYGTESAANKIAKESIALAFALIM